MKTGIIRKIDDLGRIFIPKEIRRIMNIKEGDLLELSLEGNKIIFELHVLPADSTLKEAQNTLTHPKEIDIYKQRKEYESNA